MATAVALWKARFSLEDWFDHSLWLIDGSIVRTHRCVGGGEKRIRTNPKTTRWAAHVGDSRRKSTGSVTATATR